MEGEGDKTVLSLLAAQFHCREGGERAVLPPHHGVFLTCPAFGHTDLTCPRISFSRSEMSAEGSGNMGKFRNPYIHCSWDPTHCQEEKEGTKFQKMARQPDRTRPFISVVSQNASRGQAGSGDW